ncbi:type VI secretion system baseplate subunit TssE [Pirellulales bacterium]|nr:type VI secretion system baseplate subunit TssE [Pirellulales bacterium]
MAELTPQERLQPALLDRLADDEPDKLLESRDKRILSIERLHDCVVRDLSWLLNAENLASAHDLEEFPDAAASTINYGIPAMSGQIIVGKDRTRIEDSIRQSILRFEPRLLPNTVHVRASLDDGDSRPNAMAFEIEASVWAQPIPLQLLVKAEVDLETGEFQVSES